MYPVSGTVSLAPYLAQLQLSPTADNGAAGAASPAPLYRSRRFRLASPQLRRRQQQITSCVPVLRRFHGDGWVARHLYVSVPSVLQGSSTEAERTCIRMGPG